MSVCYNTSVTSPRLGGREDVRPGTQRLAERSMALALASRRLLPAVPTDWRGTFLFLSFFLRDGFVLRGRQFPEKSREGILFAWFPLIFHRKYAIMKTAKECSAFPQREKEGIRYEKNQEIYRPTSGDPEGMDLDGPLHETI